MYTSDEPDQFSLEWFLNVMSGIQSTYEGQEAQVQLISIDSHSAIITINVPENGPPLSPPASPDGYVLSRTPSFQALQGTSPPESPLRLSDSQIKPPDEKSRTLRFPRFLSFQRHSSPPEASSPPRVPSTTSLPTNTPHKSSDTIPASPSAPPVPMLHFKCYLHRSIKADKFWVVLSCPSLSFQAQTTFTTILRNLRWLLNHWIQEAPSYRFATCCYSCFDMATFVKSKIANCPISQSACINAVQGLSDIVCNVACKQKLDISYLVPDLCLPLNLEKHIRAEELSNRITGGGYGDIYKHSIDGKDVAIKVTKHTSEDEIEKFVREMVLTSNLQSRGVIACVGLSRTPTLALLMEWAPLGSLQSVISHPTSLPRTLITRIAMEIAVGMKFLHECGIAFQDLKSQNVLVMSLEPSSRAPLVKLTDFGTAEYHMGFSAKYKRYCTSTYKTPETFSSKPVDMALSDIYCYGLILWELLAMKTVERHQEEQDNKIKAEKRTEIKPQDRHTLFSESSLPPSANTHPLTSILTSCLQEFPKRRVQSFTEILDRIQKLK